MTESWQYGARLITGLLKYTLGLVKDRFIRAGRGFYESSSTHKESC